MWRSAEFRARHGAGLKALFTQSLTLCAQAGLVSLGRVALDGTKVRAAASRHRAMSYDRIDLVGSQRTVTFA